MADFAPPPGPPPPKVPEGYKAVWNEQYKEWFFVNIYTKQSQWDKPTEPVYPSNDSAPPGAPPGYDSSTKPTLGAEKSGLHSNNPYNGGATGASASGISEDEQLARRLQAEEDARRGDAHRGAADGFYGGSAPAGSSPYGQTGAPQYGQQQQTYGQQDQRKSGGGGLLGKLASKLGGGGSRPQQSYGQQQPMYGHQQQYPMQGGYGGYPPQGGYGYPQQGYPPRRTGGGGMGMAGGAALGAGAGLLGGAMLMNSFDDHEQQESYQDGYQDGQQDDSGDFGGGDDGGGD